jgi:intein/homing endonuclease
VSNGHYLHFSFNEKERTYIEEVKKLAESVFGETRISESHHKKNHGTSVVVSSTDLCKMFRRFGTRSYKKEVPNWVLYESIEKQRHLIRSWYLGDGNYTHIRTKTGFKESFRICTTSQTLAKQGKRILARLGIASSIDIRDRSHEGRKTMYTVVICGIFWRNCWCAG